MCGRILEPASKIQPGYVIKLRMLFDRRFHLSELETIIDNIGLPYSGINLSYSNSAPVGTSDADI